MKKYHNQFAKQICNITVKQSSSKQTNLKKSKQSAKNPFSHHQQRIRTEPSPKNSFSEEQYEGFQSFLEINQIEETEEDENINLNINSQDLQQKLSVSFYAKEERRGSQFELNGNNNPIYQPLMCKQRPIAHLAFQQFAANSNQEYYLLNNANAQLYKAQSAKTCNSKHQQLSNQQTSVTTTVGKSSLQNTSTSKVEKHYDKNDKKQLQNLKTTLKISEKSKQEKQKPTKGLKKSQQHKTARGNNFANYFAKLTQNPTDGIETKAFLDQKEISTKVQQKAKFAYLRTPKYHFYGRAEDVGACAKSKEKALLLKL